jgi:hypothetical protein
METIEYFSDFLRKIGGVNFLAIGILFMVIWLLISGFRKGLGKKRGDGDFNDKDKKNGEE